MPSQFSDEKIEPVYGDQGEIIGFERYDETGKMVEFISYEPITNDMLNTCCGCAVGK